MSPWHWQQVLGNSLLRAMAIYLSGYNTHVSVSLSSHDLHGKVLSTLSQKSVTVAENRRKRRDNGDSRRIRRHSHFSATVAVFGDKLSPKSATIDSRGVCPVNPLDTFPRRRGSCQLVIDFSATRRTILTCQDNSPCRWEVGNKSL